jgi:nucleoside-diphosphate-sugar epimerase
MLITGANGVIGSDLVRFFSKEIKVYAVYRTPNLITKNLKSNNIIWIKQDLSKRFITKIKPKIIIHCAVTHALSKKNDLIDFIDSNLLGLKNILDFAKKSKVKKFFHLSSLNIYGDIKTKVLKETNPFITPDLLGASKIMMEKFIENQSIDYLNIRLPGVVGYQINDPRRPWICKIVNKLKKNRKVEIFNSTKPFNNIMDSYEVYRFIDFIKKKPLKKGSINLSATKPIKLKNIITYIKDRLDSKSKITFNKKYSKYFVISNEKVLEHYNYKASSTKKIINRYIESFLD